MQIANIIVVPLQLLLSQLIGFIPKILVALIIWLIGKYIINLGVGLIKKVEFKKFKVAGKFRDTFAFFLLYLGKVLLVLIILDYLGIGRTVIQALLSGLTFAIAIALGIAFGKALEDDARALLSALKEQVNK